jgi:hypothetical protein
MIDRNFTPTLEGNLQSKLKALVNSANQNDKKSSKEEIKITRHFDLKPIENIGEDGVDHLNIWSFAKTELGVLLSFSTNLRFNHEQLFNFSSIDCLWQYITIIEPSEKIRNVPSRILRSMVKELPKRSVVNFRAVIMDANWQKIQQYPDIKDAIIESTLPFDFYYFIRATETRVRYKNAFWVLKGFEEIRKALKEARDPNFDFLIDDKEIGIYGDLIIPVIQKPKAKKKKKKAKVAVVEPDNTETVSGDDILNPVVEPELAASVTDSSDIHKASALLAKIYK